MKSTRVRADAALILASVALVFAMTGGALADRHGAEQSKRATALKLGRDGKVPARLLPKVARARNADRLGGSSVRELTSACNSESVDIGTYCVMAAVYVITNEEAGLNNYFFATRKCAELGGWLPTAEQLLGPVNLLRLGSTVDDAPEAASIDDDPADGVKDRREMTATLVTTAAGSSAAGSQGVTDGSTGDPRQGEPNPVPAPANPAPETLQYVTVYDNGDHGGFAGSKPVSQPERFRCAFAKRQGAGEGSIG